MHTLKTQRPSNLTNITKNLNLKGKTLKYLEQKNNKLVSAKEPLKIKSNFKNNLNININPYSTNPNPSQQTKGLLNSIHNYKKISLDKKERNNNNHYLNTENKKKLEIKDYKTYKEVTNSKNRKKDLFDEKWQRLNTEIIHNKNKNYLENKRQINYINNTIDSIKNNIGYISDIKKTVLGSKINRKKNDINLYLNERREKRKNTDIKRIKSTNFSYNNNTISINPTFNNTTIKKNIFPKNPLGKKLLNRLQLLTNKNNNTDLIYANNFNYSNRKSTFESELCDNNIKTEPSTEFYPKNNNRDNHFNHIKTNTVTSTSTNSNTIQTGKLHRGIYPKKLNYNYPATYFRYLNSIRKVPNYTLTKNNNLIKNLPHNDIFRNTINKDRKLIIPKNNETTITSKKNPFVTIRNTVINFNMIDPGLIVPSYNRKTLDRKKYNLIGPYNTQSQTHPNKKYSKDPSDIYAQKTYNNSINKIQNLNNCTFKPLLKNNKGNITNHCNNHSLSINNNSINTNKDLFYSANRRLKTQTIQIDSKNSAISSFNKLVNKMKNKQLYNKRHSNSVEKNHNIFKCIKLNEYYLKNMKNRNERKTLEINSGINNFISSNKYKPINITNKNYTLPALFMKSKKFYNPKAKGFLIQPQVKNLNINDPLESNNITENNRQYFLKGINNNLKI